MTREPYIRRIEIFPVAYPTRGSFKFLQTPAGLPSGRRTVVVKVTDDEGLVGWGQAVPSHRWSFETPETVRSTIEHYLAPELIGRTLGDCRTLLQSPHCGTGPGFSAGHQLAKAGIDIALWDLWGRRQGQPVWALLRGIVAAPPVERITLSWTVNETSLAEVERSIAEAHSLGYRNFNVKLDGDVERDLELCRLVVRLAPEAFTWVDANGGYRHVDDALEIAPKLTELGIAAFEQPLRANNLSGYQRLQRQAAILIILDESIADCTDFDEFHKLGLMNGVAIKVARMGGISGAGRLAERLRATDSVAYASGLTDPDLSLAASLHVFAAAGITLPAALNGPQFLTGSILREPLLPVGDQLTVPTGPGLGVEVDEVRLRELSERTS